MEEAGAVMVRDKNHLRFRLANGKMLTMAKTPSDHRSLLNAVSQLRRLMA